MAYESVFCYSKKKLDRTTVGNDLFSQDFKNMNSWSQFCIVISLWWGRQSCQKKCNLEYNSSWELKGRRHKNLRGRRNWERKENNYIKNQYIVEESGLFLVMTSIIYWERSNISWDVSGVLIVPVFSIPDTNQVQWLCNEKYMLRLSCLIFSHQTDLQRQR